MFDCKIDLRATKMDECYYQFFSGMVHTVFDFEYLPSNMYWTPTCLGGMCCEKYMSRYMIKNTKYGGKNTTKNWWIYSIDQTLWTWLNEISYNGRATCVEDQTLWYKEWSKKTQRAKDHRVGQDYVVGRMVSKNIL